MLPCFTGTQEKFGFNKTTVATFIRDRVKAALLALLLGSPVLAVVLWFLGSLDDLGLGDRRSPRVSLALSFPVFVFVSFGLIWYHDVSCVSRSES